METKFTPAPWLMNVTKEFINNKGLAITNDQNSLICEVSHQLTDFTLNEYVANAKLICAAPDLLEALLEYKRLYEAIQPTGGWQGVYEMGDYAIKKATE